MPEDAKPSQPNNPAVDRARRWGIVAWSAIGILILAAAALWVLLLVRDIVPPLVLALATIYVLNPLVARMERLGVGRLLGSCFSYTIFFAFVGLALLLIIPSLVDQAQDFARDFPDTVESIGDAADRFSEELEARFGADVDVAGWLGGRTDLLTSGLAGIGGFLRGAVHTVALLAIGLVIGFYLLVDLPRLRGAATNLIPPDRRGEATDVARAVGRAMGGFFRGQLLVALIVGIMSAAALRIIGLPYWLVIGMIAGFFNLIPLIGPYVGAIPAIIIAAALMPPITILWVAVALTAVQQIDNHLISPNVMRWTVRLHPVTVILSLIVGATLAGFWGMLLAVPVTAAVKVVAAYFWRTRVPWGNDVFEAGDELALIGGEKRSPRPEDVADDEEGPPTEVAQDADAAEDPAPEHAGGS